IQPVLKPFFTDRLDHKPGKKKVPEPVGKGNVPPVPKLLDIYAEKWAAEVLRCPDTKNITGSYSHQAVTGKIKKQVKAITVRICDHVVPIFCYVYHTHSLVEKGSNH